MPPPPGELLHTIGYSEFTLKAKIPILPAFVGKHNFDLHVHMEISVPDLGKLSCMWKGHV